MTDLPWTRIRERTGLTQDDVANALGVVRPLVSYWENGARPMDRRWIAAVGYFDQTLADLAGLLGFGEPIDLPYNTKWWTSA